MKKLILLLFVGIFLISCSGSEYDANGIPIDKRAKSKETPAETIEPIKEDIYKEYHVTYTSVSTDSSYWFVQLAFIREGGGQTTIHGVVGLPMPYFDFAQARSQFKRAGEAYFEFFTQITKESYDSFYEYSRNNEKPKK